MIKTAARRGGNTSPESDFLQCVYLTVLLLNLIKKWHQTDPDTYYLTHYRNMTYTTSAVLHCYFFRLITVMFNDERDHDNSASSIPSDSDQHLT